MKYGGIMRFERNLMDQIRSTMAPGNPVPGHVPNHDRLRQAAVHERVVALQVAGSTGPSRADGRRSRNGGASQRRPSTRLLAPVAAALALITVIAGLTLAGRAAGRPSAAGQPTASDQRIPRFYVTINGLPPDDSAVVHDSLTGRVLSSVKLPAARGALPSITAAESDRDFVIDTAKALPHSILATVLYLLHVSSSGRSETLMRLPGQLTSPGSAAVVDGIAVSPNGARLAVALQIPTVGFRPRGEIVVVSLPGGPNQIWRASGAVALPWDPIWTGGNRQLSFLWWDHLKGPVNGFTARTQVRVLDTAAPGRNLLTSRVLATGGGNLGFIQTALAAPGGPIIATVYRNVPATGKNGVATVRLVALSATTGRVDTVFVVLVMRYHSLAQRNKADDSCQVLGLDAAGNNAIVKCLRLFRLRFPKVGFGRFTPLRTGSGLVIAAAW